MSTAAVSGAAGTFALLEQRNAPETNARRQAVVLRTPLYSTASTSQQAWRNLRPGAHVGGWKSDLCRTFVVRGLAAQ